MENRSNAHAHVAFTVMLSASGRAEISKGHRPSVVHAVLIRRSSQSWTVIREHVDFVDLGITLSTMIGKIPKCPPAPTFDSKPSNGDHERISKTRDLVQKWLADVLLCPGTRESAAVAQFLTDRANIIPDQFEDVSWILFSSNVSEQPNPSETDKPNIDAAQNHVDEFEMDEVFDYEGADCGDHDEDDDDYEDDIEYFKASERYQPTQDDVTLSDMMEIQNHADDLEMIEDVGSLAQSLGASHLGRSLQLQAEMTSMEQNNKASKYTQPATGLNVDGISLRPHINKTCMGGIGRAVNKPLPPPQSKVEGIGDSFNQRKPVSAPALDSFDMIKVIGKGSFGKVFLAREKKTQEMFALKVLRKDNIIKRNQVEHTRTERSVLGYVDHPFIVGLNMAFQSKDKLYFVLDYCAGGELFFHLSKVGKFPEPRACFYASEIILAIACVHKLDIIYRDLKPENVLLDARGHVRLTDFGLSKEGITSSSTGATSFCGTPEYLAPEILNRQGHGRAVDWWSLGALLYEMLTGLPPFYCRDREKLFEKIRKGHLDYPNSLSARSQVLLRGLLTKDPKKRLGSGPNDALDIQQHTFFSEIDWKMLANGETVPPWNPKIHGSLDTSQFDEEFTSMPIFSPSSFQAPPGFHGKDSQDNVFEGFTFTDKGFYGGSPTQT